jgi:hypothetical protein
MIVHSKAKFVGTLLAAGLLTWVVGPAAADTLNGQVLGGGHIAALSTAWSFQPDLSIATSTNVDPAQTFATEFAVTNTGKVLVRNLRFACALKGSAISMGFLRIGSDTIAPVENLPKGQTVTRGCFKESRDIVGASLLVTVNYDWPILPITGTKATLFVPVKTTSGFVMVPDYQNPTKCGSRRRESIGDLTDDDEAMSLERPV